MKLTKAQIQQIIKEELENLEERNIGPDADKNVMAAFKATGDRVEAFLSAGEGDSFLLPSTEIKGKPFAFHPFYMGSGKMGLSDENMKQIMKVMNQSIFDAVLEVGSAMVDDDLPQYSFLGNTANAKAMFKEAASILNKMIDAGKTVPASIIREISSDPQLDPVYIALFVPYLKQAASVFGVAGGVPITFTEYTLIARPIINKIEKANEDKETVRPPFFGQHKRKPTVLNNSKEAGTIKASHLDLQPEVLKAIIAAIPARMRTRIGNNKAEIEADIKKLMEPVEAGKAPQGAQAAISKLASQGDNTMGPGAQGPRENLKLTKSELQRIIQEELENVTKGN